jgi:hypothetical protein
VFFVIHCTGLWLTGGETETGQYIREHSSPDDRIFVWGQSPSIYLDARRRPASRYITTFPLTGYIFGPPMADVDTHDRIVPGAWSNLEQDLNAHPPAFIVDTEMDGRARYPLALFPALARLVAERYRLVARTGDGLIYRRMIEVGLVSRKDDSGSFGTKCHPGVDNSSPESRLSGIIRRVSWAEPVALSWPASCLR